jgi:hypothetical protein
MKRARLCYLWCRYAKNLKANAWTPGKRKWIERIYFIDDYLRLNLPNWADTTSDEELQEM